MEENKRNKKPKDRKVFKLTYLNVMFCINWIFAAIMIVLCVTHTVHLTAVETGMVFTGLFAMISATLGYWALESNWILKPKKDDKENKENKEEK